MADTQEPWTLTARWIFPADKPPLPQGTITIQGDKIVAVEPAGTRSADEDLGKVAILPGLVNAHTHLDLSDARGKIPPTPDFTAWLRGVIQHRRGQTLEHVQQAIRDGICESTTRGVTLLADIAAGGQSWELLACAPMRALVHFEMLGLTLERALDSTDLALAWLRHHRSTSACRPALSPHAPYSFRAEFLPQIARNVAGIGRRVSIHLAESAAECELLYRQTGAFIPFLLDLGVWDRTGLARNLGHVIEFLSSAEELLLIHCNYLPNDIPIPKHAAVGYCPRTHAAFGHPPHPFREFLKRGVRVVLGTDSLASNPDLDILAEARFVAARHPDLAGETLLRMITLDSAIALGWGDVAGSLTPGKSADLVVLPLPDRDDADPHRLLFDSESRARRVLFRGEWTV
jgi:aminodeoxyfutalosine deaminase